MPSWGRPSGARKGKRGKERDRQTRQREEAKRFEEIDSDDDDGQGVGLSRPYVSDELYFTGADLSRSSPRNQRTYSRDYISESSEDEEDADESLGGTMQLALRDKEELLVHKALERIRRAQMLGRTNVKLTQPEIDALARKRRKDEASRKSPLSSSRTTQHRRSGDQLGETEEQRPSNRRLRTPLSMHESGEFPSPGRATPPGILLPGTDGNASYHPFGHHSSGAPESYNRSSRSGSRSASSHSQQQSTPPLPPGQLRPSKGRYFSVPEASQPPPPFPPNTLLRRLPDDPNWIPRPGSSSSNPTQTYSPPSPHVPPRRRIVSGPPESHYVGSRRGDSSPMPYSTISEPSHMHREHSGHGGDDHTRANDDTEEDDDDDYGVQVDVVPFGQGYGINVRAEEGAAIRPRRGER